MTILESNRSVQEFKVSINTTEAKILDFLKLPTGWHFGSGKPPMEGTVRQALRILYIAQTYSLITDAIPGVDGEIQVLCFREDETLEFTVKGTDDIIYALDRNGEEISYYENLDLKESLGYLNAYGIEKCNSSELSTLTATSSTEKDSLALRLAIPETRAEYQWCL